MSAPLAFPPRRDAALLALCVATALAAPARAGVHTVAPAGADHTQITQAITAAAPGDVVLVRAGSYDGFTLDGLPLHIVAEVGASVVVHGQVVVRNLAAGDCALLSGLRLAGAAASALVLRDDAGAVRLVDVVAWVAPNYGPAALATVRIEGCADVALSACSLQGGFGPSSYAAAGTALSIAGGRVAIDGGSAIGGAGMPGSAHASPGGPGGIGIDCAAGELFLAGTLVAGGAGGSGGIHDAGPGCAGDTPLAGGPGGIGLRAGPTAVVRALAGELRGGPGGAGGTTACGWHGMDGPGGAVATGAIEILPGPARSLRAARLAREGTDATITLAGEPGDRAWVFVSAGPQHAWSAAFAGVALVAAPPLRRLHAGTVPASGELGVALAVPELGPGVDARPLHLQALFASRVAGPRLSGARLLVLIDRIY